MDIYQRVATQLGQFMLQIITHQAEIEQLKAELAKLQSEPKKEGKLLPFEPPKVS